MDMESVIETLSELMNASRADARLTLMVVVEAMREVVSDDVAWAISDELPHELGLLMRPVRVEDPVPACGRDFVPAEHVELVCSLIAHLAPARFGKLIAEELPYRLAAFLRAHPDRVVAEWTSDRPTTPVPELGPGPQRSSPWH
jgi:uncharacterized protein (DUF2267 family)